MHLRSDCWEERAHWTGPESPVSRVRSIKIPNLLPVGHESTVQKSIRDEDHSDDDEEVETLAEDELPEVRVVVME